MGKILLTVLALASALASAATPVVKERKGGAPVIALEAVPWDFELPRGFLVNRLLSKTGLTHMRPLLSGELHLREVRENYERHKKSFPGSGIEPFDNGSWTITIDVFQGGEAQCLERYLNKAREHPEARSSKTKMTIHGQTAYRILVKARVTEENGLILALKGGGCLVINAPPVSLEKNVWDDGARAINHIAKTLTPRGFEPKKPRSKPVHWSKVPERYMFDGLESRGGGRRAFRSAF